MKRGMYLRLAMEGMRKNRRLYLPYLMTGGSMAAVFYILTSLARSPLMQTMRGGSTMALVLSLGTVVIALFSLLFLFYANSFLIRRRNREFGLYNVLGMNKGNISRILLWEALLTALLTLAIGLACGLLLAKLAEIFLLRMAGERADYALSVHPGGILAVILFFGLIHALLLIVCLARVRLSKPLDLLKSEAAGEKPPRANWLLAAAGLLILGAAYVLALRIREPLAAVNLFFLAVLLVILGTYLLFIAGSVALCRLLQKNKGYYYRPAHFVSVSSMVYRMKRNGAGLASICILATMVLVMLSSTSCLYFGGENALKQSYPYDLTVSLWLSSAEEREETGAQLEAAVEDVARGRARDVTSYTALDTSGYFENGTVDLNGVARTVDVTTSTEVLERVRSVSLVPLSDYNRLAGTELRLEPGECLVWSSGRPYAADTFSIKNCLSLRVRDTLAQLPIRVSGYDTIAETYFVFVPDWESCAAKVTDYAESLHEPLITASIRQYCGFDLPGLSEEEQLAAQEELPQAVYRRLSPLGLETGGLYSSRAEARSDFFSLYGSLFFLGIILSIVFIAAAALIIYYKQLSEGYEDRSRFAIMQQVGMTGDEIRSAVNSQVLTVFFAPLLMAGLHLAFAFPFVQKIIRLFGVMNVPLLILTNVLCFLAFALFYVFVYRATARAYYTIVSSGETHG